jgi:hypothetical protein
MTDTILYQSVLQKLGQLPPSSLAQLDAFLSVLIGHNTPPKIDKTPPINNKSAIDWLEQLAEIGGVSSISDPVEWQRNTRQDRKLPFR